MKESFKHTILLLVNIMFKRNKKIIKDYFSLVKFKNKYLILFIIVNLINVLVGLLIPFFMSIIVNKVTNNFYFEAFIFVVFLGLSFLFNKILSYYTNWSYANFFKEVYVDIHRLLVGSICNYDFLKLKKLSIGKIIHSSNMDIINIAEMPSFFIEIFFEIIKLIIIYFVFFRQNIIIALYVIVINVTYYNISKGYNRKSIFYLKKQRKYADKLIEVVSEIIEGFKDIKCFGIGDKLNKKLNLNRSKWQKNYFFKRKYNFIRKTLVGLIIDFGKIGLLIIMLMMISKDKMDIAMFLLLISYFDKIKESTNNIISFDVSIMEEAVCLYRIRDIIFYKNKLTGLYGRKHKSNVLGFVEFRNVSFKYSQNLLLKDISFCAYPESITAIVGKTGVGKTTIFNLLLKLIRVQKGEIFIDDINIYEYSLDTFNSIVTVVNQKTFIFNMSIRDNLSLIDANKKRQIEVCKKVGIHDFIMSLPKGYNTILKDDATNISGGQKQLLSLARALLSNTKIILLDEVTSSLDPNTREQIIKLLEELKFNHTLIVITHEMELMKIADRIIVLENKHLKIFNTTLEMLNDKK